MGTVVVLLQERTPYEGVKSTEHYSTLRLEHTLEITTKLEIKHIILDSERLTYWREVSERGHTQGIPLGS